MNRIAFNVAMAKAGKTNRDMAREIGVSDQAFYNKLNGATEYKSSEIKKIAEILSLSMDDVNSIFFDSSVN